MINGTSGKEHNIYLVKNPNFEGKNGLDSVITFVYFNCGEIGDQVGSQHFAITPHRL